MEGVNGRLYDVLVDRIYGLHRGGRERTGTPVEERQPPDYCTAGHGGSRCWSWTSRCAVSRLESILEDRARVEFRTQPGLPRCRIDAVR